jgi:uncharacterized protein YjbI with pentapeptide repeats
MLRNIQKLTFENTYKGHQEWINKYMAPGVDPASFSLEDIKEHENIDGLRGSLRNTNLFQRETEKKDRFFKKDFRYFDFSGSSFSTSSVSKVNTNTEFYESVFIGCDFSKCNLSYISAQNCTFSGCDFRQADLSHAIFRKCKLRNCNFQRSKFSHTEITDSDLFGSDMSICKIENCRIFNCIATGVSLLNTELTECNLRLLRFKEINMDNCIVKNCDVKYSDFQNIYNRG